MALEMPNNRNLIISMVYFLPQVVNRITNTRIIQKFHKNLNKNPLLLFFQK